MTNANTHEQQPSCFERTTYKLFLTFIFFCQLFIHFCPPTTGQYEQNPNAPSPLGQMPPNDGMAGGPMPPGFFPVS